jgi:hypothetical protein
MSPILVYRDGERDDRSMTWRRAILLLTIGLAIGLIVAMRH